MSDAAQPQADESGSVTKTAGNFVGAGIGALLVIIVSAKTDDKTLITWAGGSAPFFSFLLGYVTRALLILVRYLGFLWLADREDKNLQHELSNLGTGNARRLSELERERQDLRADRTAYYRKLRKQLTPFK